MYVFDIDSSHGHIDIIIIYTLYTHSVMGKISANSLSDYKFIKTFPIEIFSQCMYSIDMIACGMQHQMCLACNECLVVNISYCRYDYILS